VATNTGFEDLKRPGRWRWWSHRLLTAFPFQVGEDGSGLWRERWLVVSNSLFHSYLEPWVLTPSSCGWIQLFNKISSGFGPKFGSKIWIQR
jgi:hypothetical protein